jgi:hypothetical protein
MTGDKHYMSNLKASLTCSTANLDIDVNLDLALKKLHELALADGDLGYTYWFKISKLLKAAPELARHIRILERQHDN